MLRYSSQLSPEVKASNLKLLSCLSRLPIINPNLMVFFIAISIINRAGRNICKISLTYGLGQCACEMGEMWYFLWPKRLISAITLILLIFRYCSLLILKLHKIYSVSLKFKKNKTYIQLNVLIKITLQDSQLDLFYKVISKRFCIL